MGYSSVLLGQLVLFNGPLARYHIIRKCYDRFDLKPQRVVTCQGIFVKASQRPYTITPRKCGIVPDQHIYVVGFKVLLNFYANCGESVQPLQSVKLIYQPCSRSIAGWTLISYFNQNLCYVSVVQMFQVHLLLSYPLSNKC